MKRALVMIFVAFGVFCAGLAPAQTASDISETEVETRAREVGRALRCVVCQNQSIEESDASLAEDMRGLVRARIRQGDSNDDVIDYMQSRYGDFVLLEPPVQKNTYILWAAPFLILLLALFWFWRTSKRLMSKPE